MRFALLTVVASLVFAASASADDIIVGFSTPDHAAAHRAAGGTVKGQIGGINADVVSVPDGQAKAFIDRYKRQKGVRYAEVDVEVRALTDDPGFKYQWHLNNADVAYGGNPVTIQPDSTSLADADIDQPEAWTAAGTPPTVKVAVLDTGIDQDHEDLSAYSVSSPSVLGVQKNFTTSKTIDDLYGHGTHVAGIIAAKANNTLGVSGVARNVQLLNGKVLGDNGSGSCSGVAQGMIWAADQGARVISMSLGGSACTAEQNAVSYAWDRGSLVIAAAGNSSTNAYSYPAAYAPALAVAATDNSDQLASFSNYGSWVEIAAPGVDIYSTLPNHTSKIRGKNYGYLSGTSMATPVVSGIAALVTLSDANTNGRTNDELRARLVSSADRPTSVTSRINGGRANACRAVSGLSTC